jgi:arylsulfatase A-like enzyme
MEPFFAYLHLIDPHGPYSPSPDVAARFVDADYDGQITGSINDFVSLTQNQGEPQDLQRFSDLYDAEIASTDASLGRFLDWLEQEGLLDNSHVLVTSDHGEEFLEHGGTGHGRKVFEEQVRIPLIWRGPGLPAGVGVAEVGGLIDLAPTLLDVLGITRDDYGPMRGRSLRPQWTGQHIASKHQIVFLEEFAGTLSASDQPDVIRAMVAGDSKIIASPVPVDKKSCESLVWFDLVADPAEKNGVEISCQAAPSSSVDQRIVEFYSSAAQAFLSDNAAAGSKAELSEEHLEMLRSLGYLD